jgi:hypothetical protein
MDDQVIVIGTQVDLSALKTGMAEAQTAVKAATQAMAEAQLQFGKAAEQGNQQAQAALRQYEAELQTAQAAVLKLASAESEEGTVLRGTTSARMAASAELRVLEGNFNGSTRAAGAFLSQLPGIGAAMQLAFPVFGAIAVVEIFTRISKAASDSYENIVNLKAVNEQIDGVHRLLAQSSQSVEDHLEAQRIQYIRLAEGIVAATKAERDFFASKAINLDNVFSSKDFQAMPDAIKHGFEDAYKVIDPKDLPNKIKQLGGEIQSLQSIAAKPIEIQMGPGTMGDAAGFAAMADSAIAEREKNQNAARLKLAQDLYKRLQDSEADYSQTVKTYGETISKEQAAQDEKRAKSASRTLDLMISEMIAVDKMAVDSSQRVTDAIGETWQKLYKQDEEAQKTAEKYEAEATRAFIANSKQQVDALRLVEEEKIKAAQEKFSNTEKNTQVSVQLGDLNPAQRLEILRSALDQEYKVISAAKQRIAALDAGDVAKQQKEQNEMLQAQRQYEQQFTQLNQQASLSVHQQWQSAFTQINGTFQTALNGWIQGTQSFENAMTKAWEGIAAAAVKNILQIMAMSAMQAAQGKATALEQKLDAAKLAFANTYATVSAWPVVGPILAPEIAAGAFAAVAAFEHGGIVGGQIGSAVPIVAHAGERVLSQSQTQNFESMVNNSSKQGGDSHFHYSPQISGIDGASVAGMARTHGSAFLREANRQMRIRNL